MAKFIAPICFWENSSLDRHLTRHPSHLKILNTQWVNNDSLNPPIAHLVSIRLTFEKKNIVFEFFSHPVPRISSPTLSRILIIWFVLNFNFSCQSINFIYIYGLTPSHVEGMTFLGEGEVATRTIIFEHAGIRLWNRYQSLERLSQDDRHLDLELTCLSQCRSKVRTCNL